jgi:hypothetical protein
MIEQFYEQELKEVKFSKNEVDQEENEIVERILKKNVVSLY